MAYTDIDNPELHHQTKLYTGTGTSTAFTLDGSKNMQPDWVWIKERGTVDDGSANDTHAIFDSVRGVQKRLISNNNSAEGTQSNGITAFGSNGFTSGDANITNGGSSRTYAAWCWKAGGSASSNSNGSISSSVSANTTAGFSIVSWRGDGSNATIGHGLCEVPKWIIVKNRESTEAWAVYHGSNTSAPETDYLILNTDAATTDGNTTWNDTAPTSSVFTVSTSPAVNANTQDMIAYCFSEVKGYSKFGSYTANGNADGTFIYTGFRPAWVMIKRTDSSQQWGIVDSKRDVDNPAQHHLFAEADQGEGGASSYNNFDLLSNGIKMRSNDQWTNASGGTYVYMAFAESPFVNSNGIPNNAR